MMETSDPHFRKENKKNPCQRILLQALIAFYPSLDRKSVWQGESQVEDGFHTFGEYMKMDDTQLTASMEDYLEMIYRLCAADGFTRIHELSHALNVQPSSATKMVQRLSDTGYLRYEKYGFLMLEDRGRQTGAWLLRRHHIVEQFMRLIGVGETSLLAETEKVEHTLGRETVMHMEAFAAFLTENPDILGRYRVFHQGKT